MAGGYISTLGAGPLPPGGIGRTSRLMEPSLQRLTGRAPPPSAASSKERERFLQGPRNRHLREPSE